MAHCFISLLILSEVVSYPKNVKNLINEERIFCALTALKIGTY